MRTNYQPLVADLVLGNGQRVQWRFGPRTLLIDDSTDFVLGMYMELASGEGRHVMLRHPDEGAYKRSLFLRDLLSQVGGEVVGDAIRIESAFLDNVIAALAQELTERTVDALWANVIFSESQYFAIEDGEMIVSEALTISEFYNV